MARTVPLSIRCLIVLALATPAAALACRCAPQPLAAYLDAADHVFVARVEATTVIPDDTERVLTLTRDGSAYKGSPDSVTQFRTGTSSASCGVRVEPGTTLVVFAQDDPTRPGVAHVHTCNGTRVLDPAGGLGDFEDVPSALVRTALRRLTQGSESTGELATHSEPVPVGLVSIPALGKRQPVPVFAVPGQACGRRLLLRGEELIMRDNGYQLPAAVVIDIRDGWYRLMLTDPTGGGQSWLSPTWVDRYWPLAE